MAFRDEALMPTAKSSFTKRCVFGRFRNVVVEASAPYTSTVGLKICLASVCSGPCSNGPRRTSLGMFTA